MTFINDIHWLHPGSFEFEVGFVIGVGISSLSAAEMRGPENVTFLDHFKDFTSKCHSQLSRN